jgi:hypothetical protein
MPRKRKTEDQAKQAAIELNEGESKESPEEELEELEETLASEFESESELGEEEEVLEAEAETEAADAPEPMATADDRGVGLEEFEEEEEEIPEVHYRRETRQEMLGRLMHRLLDAREQVHQALNQVRDLNTQLRDAGPRPPEKLKEQYHKAITELSGARREENFARAELMQTLNWRG